MCEFPSWFEKADEQNPVVLYLTNEKLKSDRGKALIKYLGVRTDDICGHGAIRYFYKIKSRDVSGNYPKFDARETTNPDYIPNEIIIAIKKGKMTKVGYNEDLLTQKGKDKFKTICRDISDLCWSKYDDSNLNLKERHMLHRKINEEVHQKKMEAFWKLFKKYSWKFWRT